jgi:hypothetical protein
MWTTSQRACGILMDQIEILSDTNFNILCEKDNCIEKRLSKCRL